MRLILGSRLSVFKCRVAASLRGVKLIPERSYSKKNESITLIRDDGFSVFGEHAICQLLMSDKVADTLKVSRWLEMDSKGDIDAFKCIDPSHKYLVNDSLSVADVCIGCSLLFARNSGSTLTKEMGTWLDSILQNHKEFHAAWKRTEIDMQLLFSNIACARDQKSTLLRILNEVGSIALSGRDRASAQKANVKNQGLNPDYQLNNGISSFKKLKDSFKSPRDLALFLEKEVRSQSDVFPSIIEKTEVAGAGFLNLYLNQDFVAQKVARVIADGELKPYSTIPLKVGVDFSSPNVAKEMHVGHLRSTIIGEVICRSLTFLGHDVGRINHVGDWGTQFGMLLVYMRQNHPDHLKNPPTIGDLNSFYKQAKQAFDASEEFKQESRQEVVKLQSGDPAALASWKQFIDISFEMCNAVYKRLGVTFPDGICGESFYNSRIPSTVAELEKIGLIEMSDGAKVIFTEAYQVPLFLVKRDGGYGYDSTDMAALRYRTQELGQDWIIYITDSGQENHFKACFEAGGKAGWIDNVRLDHVGFGVVQGKDRKRFKTRDGSVVRLVDLLDEAKSRMLNDLTTRKEQGRTKVSDCMLEETASGIGYSAVKFADLKNTRERDYVFDYDQMLQSDGETAVYLIYSYARICGIIRNVESKCGISSADDLVKEKLSSFKVSRDRPAEWDLAIKILAFSDSLMNSVEELRPHHLCSYAFELSAAFAKFYTSHQLVINGPEGTKQLDPEHGENWLVLLAGVKIALRDTFKLLGIEKFEEI